MDLSEVHEPSPYTVPQVLAESPPGWAGLVGELRSSMLQEARFTGVQASSGALGLRHLVVVDNCNQVRGSWAFWACLPTPGLPRLCHPLHAGAGAAHRGERWASCPGFASCGEWAGTQEGPGQVPFWCQNGGAFWAQT